MNVIVCVDDNGGVLFNKRRVSRDRVVTEDIVHTATGTLFVTPYTARLFEGIEAPLCVSETAREEAKDGDTYVCEDGRLADLTDRLETVTVYRWNRVYPHDTALDTNLKTLFVLRERVDFPGFSHERITRETWVRVDKGTEPVV